MAEKTYSREELDQKQRPELRTIAKNIETIQMPMMELVRLKEPELRDLIMEHQAPAGKKAVTRTPKTPAKEVEPVQERKPRTPAKAAAEEMTDPNDVCEKIDALGKTLDEDVIPELKTTKELAESLNESLYILRGLINDIYVATLDEDTLKERTEALAEEFEQAGNE